jgi:hypothetical protein
MLDAVVMFMRKVAWRTEIGDEFAFGWPVVRENTFAVASGNLKLVRA